MKLFAHPGRQSTLLRAHLESPKHSKTTSMTI